MKSTSLFYVMIIVVVYFYVLIVLNICLFVDGGILIINLLNKDVQVII